MNEHDFARRCLTALKARQPKVNAGPPKWPYLLVKQTIWSQDELRTLTDEDVRRLFDKPEYWPPDKGPNIRYMSDPYSFVWQYRNAHRTFADKDPGNMLAFNHPTLHPNYWILPAYPLLLFWPPDAPDQPPALVWWETLCTKEAALEGCHWLMQQDLPPYAGPRVPVYWRSYNDYTDYWDMSQHQLIEPIPLILSGDTHE